MLAPAPSRLAYVPFVSVENMMKLVHRIGIAEMLTGLAEYIEQDFRRWELFDKTPRVASHSREGVIELMPTSDGEDYGFKYVNGHPKNTREGLQTDALTYPLWQRTPPRRIASSCSVAICRLP